MADSIFLAADFGASSGRLVAARFDGRRLVLEDLHRFENRPVWVGESMLWNWLGLWTDLQDGLAIAGSRYGSEVRSLGVDTWGVDFALLGENNAVIANPVHYRDSRTAGILQHALSRIPREEIFAETGLQFLEFNTLFQLLALQQVSPDLLKAAQRLLLMPDLFHWLLSGEVSNEQTNASTTQLYNPTAGTWSEKLIRQFDFPERIFGTIVPPGTRLGDLRGRVASDTGLARIEIIAPPTHDTASAVLAVPAAGGPAARPDWCYISSGTWSLMGVETTMANVSDECREENFTNEAGVANTTRLLKNIAGMWLVQECRRIWVRDGDPYDWSELVAMAQQAEPLVSIFDPEDPRLINPTNMPEMIQQLCREGDRGVPQTHGAIIRAALESLAVRYREVLKTLERLTGGEIKTIHIVGGGSQNELLSQMTADATGRVTVTGPVEATAIGNALQQAIAAGLLGSVADARAVVRASFELKSYHPCNTSRWDEVVSRS